MNEMRTALYVIGNRADMMEERISEFENRNLEMVKVGERRVR